MAPKKTPTGVANIAPAAKATAAPLSGGASSSSGDSQHRPASIIELAQQGSERATEVTTSIEDLIQAQKDMRAHRRKLSADLKNARRKKARLQQRARLLTTEDLLTVVALREAKAAEEAAARAASSTEDAEAEPVSGEPLASRGDNEKQTQGADDDDGILHDAVRSPA